MQTNTSPEALIQPKIAQCLKILAKFLDYLEYTRNSRIIEKTVFSA